MQKIDQTRIHCTQFVVMNLANVPLLQMWPELDAVSLWASRQKGKNVKTWKLSLGGSLGHAIDRARLPCVDNCCFCIPTNRLQKKKRKRSRSGGTAPSNLKISLDSCYKGGGRGYLLTAKKIEKELKEKKKIVWANSLAREGPPARTYDKFRFHVRS